MNKIIINFLKEIIIYEENNETYFKISDNYWYKLDNNYLDFMGVGSEIPLKLPDNPTLYDIILKIMKHNINLIEDD